MFTVLYFRESLFFKDTMQISVIEAHLQLIGATCNLRNDFANFSHGNWSAGIMVSTRAYITSLKKMQPHCHPKMWLKR